MDNRKEKDERFRDSNERRGNERRGKRNQRDPRKSSRESTRDKYVGTGSRGDNDPSWYKQLPQIFEDVTNISLYNPTGLPFIWGTDKNGFNEKTQVVPGVMALNTVITPGWAGEQNDGFNQSVINLFEYVRKSLNKPTFNYSAPDLGIMCYCIMNVYAQYANLVRGFGLLGKWDADNLYTPRTILRCGYYGMKNSEYKYAVANIANLRARFNLLIHRASSLFLPTSFKLMDRYAWLFLNVWRDHATQKSQFYLHSLDGFYMWNETKYDTGSAAVYTPIIIDRGATGTDTADVFGQLLDYFEQSIEALRTSSSCWAMTSDMRNAFSNNSAWKLAWLDEEFQIEYGISDEVLMQIENTIVAQTTESSVAPFTSNNSADVTQDVNKEVVIYQPYAEFTEHNEADLNVLLNVTGCANPVLNFHTSDVTKDQLMVATRNKFITKYDEGANRLYLKCASDYVNNIMICASPNSNPNPWNPYLRASANAFTLKSKIFTYSAFDWIPPLIALDDNDNLLWYVTEYDNYGTSSVELQELMDRAAIISMWYISEFGSWEAK